MLHLNRPLLKTALFSTFALTCLTGLAQNPPPLVLTEVSRQDLTASIGSTALYPPGNNDQWTWFPPPGVILNPEVSAPFFWMEPASEPGTYNRILYTTSSSGVEGLLISSDYYQANNNNIYQNGDTEPVLTLTTSVGGVTTTVASGLQFIDDGDVAVPEGGSTLMLLGTALSGIAFLRRKVTR